MARPLLLDLFCCEGGAATGYHRAGFDVIGVDILPRSRYPFPFIQADALEALAGWDLSRFAAVHASPPCHDHVRTFVAKDGTGRLLAETREALERTGLPWVIENVPGAPMRADYKLCGCMFGLPLLKRERWFETSWRGFELRSPCRHDEPSVTASGSGIPSHSWYYGKVDGFEYHRLLREAMGISWMTRAGLVQAIPPAYTEHIGQQLISHLAARLVADARPLPAHGRPRPPLRRQPVDRPQVGPRRPLAAQGHPPEAVLSGRRRPVLPQAPCRAHHAAPGETLRNRGGTMSLTMTYTGTLVIEECCNCHITFAMPADFQRRCRDAGAAMTFYCPLGHAQHYTASEVDRLKRRLDRAEASARAARDQADAAERSRRAYKGQLTRARRRIGNGTCPCCNRHFANVERHMRGQHPGYADNPVTAGA